MKAKSEINESTTLPEVADEAPTEDKKESEKEEEKKSPAEESIWANANAKSSGKHE